MLNNSDEPRYVIQFFYRDLQTIVIFILEENALKMECTGDGVTSLMKGEIYYREDIMIRGRGVAYITG